MIQWEIYSSATTANLPPPPSIPSHTGDTDDTDFPPRNSVGEAGQHFAGMFPNFRKGTLSPTSSGLERGNQLGTRKEDTRREDIIYDGVSPDDEESLDSLDCLN